MKMLSVKASGMQKRTISVFQGLSDSCSIKLKDKCNFYFSEIEVLNGEEFFEQYIVRSA